MVAYSSVGLKRIEGFGKTGEEEGFESTRYDHIEAEMTPSQV